MYMYLYAVWLALGLPEWWMGWFPVDRWGL